MPLDVVEDAGVFEAPAQGHRVEGAAGGVLVGHHRPYLAVDRIGEVMRPQKLGAIKRPIVGEAGAQEGLLGLDVARRDSLRHPGQGKRRVHRRCVFRRKQRTAHLFVLFHVVKSAISWCNAMPYAR
jgi:hypothetical protein